LAALLALVGLWLFSACAEEFTEEFTTQLVIQSPPERALEPVEIVKRFRFSRDPESASSITLNRAFLSVTGVPDFAFLDRLEVYVLDDSVIPEERVLIAVSPAYAPGESESRLQLLFPDNLREFVREQRVRMAFVAHPSRWFDSWPDGEVIIEGRVLLDFDLF